MVQIRPERPTTRDVLEARVETYAPNALFQYRWFVDGELVANATQSTLNAGIAMRGETVLLEVAAVTDAGVSPWGGTSTVIANAAPTCSDLRISPSNPTTYDELRCECFAADDPDDTVLDAKCRWSGIGDEAQTCTATPTQLLPTDAEITCELTLSDAEGAASTAAITTSISNTPPTGGTAVIVPEQIFENSLVQCIATGATDPDGVTWSYSLFVDDQNVASGTNPTLNGNSFSKGQAIDCVATPTDGLNGGVGIPIPAPTVIVGDSPASVVSVEAAPSTLTRLDTPTCTPTMTDLDSEDVPTATIAWYRGDIALDWDAETSLGDSVAPGDIIYCKATPVGAPMLTAGVPSNELTVTNIPPQITDVSVEPQNPTALDVLVCDSAYTDEDGDTVYEEYTWSVNGALLTTSGPTLASVNAGDLVSCRVEITDTYGGNAIEFSEVVVISPSAPIVDAVTIQPALIGPCDTVSCADVNVTDPDGDSGLDVTTVLLADGTPTSEGLTFAPGTALQCVVSAIDPDGLSAVGQSEITMVGNLPPEVDGAIISPAAPIAGDTLYCSPIAATDPDCNASPSVNVEWTVGDVKTTSDSYSTTIEQEGAVVTCALSVSDGFSSSITVFESVQIAPPPSLPLVDIVIDQDGHVVCTAEATIESPAWFWRIGDGEEFQGPSFLPASLYSDCDRVFCRAESVGLSTNIAELVLPIGPDCDDGSTCTLKSCSAAGGCHYQPISGPCDDGDICTVEDVCLGTVCTGTLDDCDDNNPCTEGLCITGFGCSYGFVAGPCSDGNLCTDSDSCLSGACNPGDPVQCDDGDPCTDDACDEQLGCIGWPNTAACDDGNACTDNDICTSGVCSGSPLTDTTTCTASNDALGYCASGTCFENAAPITPTLALVPATPQAGVDVLCEATSTDPDNWPSPVVYDIRWTQEPQAILLGTGPVLSGSLIAKGAAIACRATASDGLLNSTEGVIVAPVINSPPIVSQVNVELGDSEATCAAIIDDADINDELSTQVEWLVDDKLLPLTEPTLPIASLPPCKPISCRYSVNDGSESMSLTSEPVPNMNPGSCGSEPCLQWQCANEGCESSPLGGPCDDGNPCTDIGICVGTSCQSDPLPASACDDANPCTDDYCEPNTGCQHTPKLGTPCNADNSVCTAGDVCNLAGICIAGPPISCEDGISCTPNTCDPNIGCTALLDSSDVGFAVQFGTTQEFVAYADEGTTELVQGPQGGEHIEFALKYTLPSSFDWQPLRSRVIVTLESPCCGSGGLAIGGMYLPNVLSDLEGPNTFVSGTLLGIFDQFITEEITVCATVEVSLYDEPGIAVIATSLARHVFTVVDEQ
jgi:hypothetical protein